MRMIICMFYSVNEARDLELEMQIWYWSGILRLLPDNPHNMTLTSSENWIKNDTYIFICEEKKKRYI